MNMQTQIVEAIRSELERQAEEGRLSVEESPDDVAVYGRVDLVALAAAVAGAVAGAP